MRDRTIGPIYLLGRRCRDSDGRALRSFDLNLEAIAAGNPPGRVDDHRIEALPGSSRQSYAHGAAFRDPHGTGPPFQALRTEQHFADSTLTFGAADCGL